MSHTSRPDESEDHVGVLRRMYQAFNARDLDAGLAILAADVDWTNAWEGGRLVGHDALRDYWGRQFAVMNPQVEPIGFVVAADGQIDVTVHQTVRDLDDNVVSDGEVHHLYRFDAAGLVAKMDVRAS